VDLNRVVHEGLQSLIAEAQPNRDEHDSERQMYRQAMAIALQAVVDWAQRYADAAQAAAACEQNAVIREAHLCVARACRRVPAHPARDLFEGLQAIALVHLAIAIEGHGMSVSIGSPDRVLAPFIDADFDPEHATHLIAAFMLKITANSVFGRGSKTQAITVGGADAAGKDCSNALTRCFLQACDLARIGDPHLFVRWHPALDPQVVNLATDMIARGISMPLLINDVPTAQGFVDAGISPHDAWEYCVIGCNELGIPGRLAESATPSSGSIQYLALLNQVLLEDPHLSEIKDMTDLLGRVEKRLAHHAFHARQQRNQKKRQGATRAPTPFTSALMQGCIARGQDMRIGMTYQLPGLYERGLTNAANALAAIDRLVFRDKTLTLTALREALQNNLADSILLQQLYGAPKWGNDDPEADRWALILIEMRERVLDDIDHQFGHPAHTVCHVVRSLHRVDGQRIAASPDGRLAWTPVAASIGAETGTASCGPTAILSSVLKIDAARYYRGGYNLNLMLPARSTTPGTVRGLVETFFGQGGQELQINCLDTKTLRAAQQKPDQYDDLLVRVAGFSARFIDLSLAEQNEIIARTQMA
jgi:formate C-acetyltransferase